MLLILQRSGTQYVATGTKLLRSYCAAPLIESYCKKIKHFCYKLAEISFFIIFDQNLVEYTPNANMADHSVVAWEELHESEVSQSSMFCFASGSPENSCFVIALFCFISLCREFLCFWMWREGIEIFHLSSLRENSGSMQFVEMEKRSSRSPRELNFVCYISGEKISEKSFKWRAYVESGGVPT